MKYDRDMLIQNIKILMRNNDISQEALADAVNDKVPLSQSRVSLCLNHKKSDNFTIEQLVAIADYFKVSIDSLLGLPKQDSQKPMTGRDICRQIVNIIKYTDTNIGSFWDSNWNYDFNGIYFPTSPFLGKDQREHNINTHITKFIKRIDGLNVLKGRGDLSADMFDRLVESYLNDVPEEYYITDSELLDNYPNHDDIDSELPFA